MTLALNIRKWILSPKFIGVLLLFIILGCIFGLGKNYDSKQKPKSKEQENNIVQGEITPIQEPTRPPLALLLDPKEVVGTFGEPTTTERLMITPVQPTPIKTVTGDGNGVMGVLKHLDVTRRKKGAIIGYKSGESPVSNSIKDE